MADLKIENASTTNLTDNVDDFNVSSETLDEAQNQKESYYDFPNSSEYLGYYKKIPELKRAIDALATWTCGKGYKPQSVRTEVILENIKGWGEDSFEQICFNLIVQKKVFGDAFAEIIRDEKGDLINLKPLYAGNMRVVVNEKGLIKRYEQRNKKKKIIFEPHEILHLSENRIGNEIHGNSIIESVKWVIDARNEALQDERKLKHRELAMGVLYVDTDDTTKRDEIISQYEDAVNNGEVLVLPKDVAELEHSKSRASDRLLWIQYLENFFYQAVGIPRVIATSENYTEASSKVGYLTFEPIYTWEQTQLERDLWGQLAIKIKFNRPASLAGTLQEDEEKNTGQVGFQPSETQVKPTRSE